MQAKNAAAIPVRPIVTPDNQSYVSGNARPHLDKSSDDTAERSQPASRPYEADISTSYHDQVAAGAEEEDEEDLGDFSDAYRGLTIKDAPGLGPDGLAMLWTMDEETVVQNSSDASLERIRGRLTMLLLGVSDALRTRRERDTAKPRESALMAPPEVAKTKGRAAGVRHMDFTEQVRAADHAVRRLLGEAFHTFAEGEVVQMVQLCSLADRGATDCDELVRNAVVVLQALTHDGDAVRDVAHFRQLLHTHLDEISSQQWQHDFVTAMRSLAVGFLRRPEAVMASYGASVTQVVQHEALYTALLRVCAGRPMGSGLSLASTATHADPAAPVKRKSSTSTPSTPPSHARVPRQRTPRQSTHESVYIRNPRDHTGATQLRRPSMLVDPFMPAELPQCILASTASTPTRCGNGASRSRRVSAAGHSRQSLLLTHDGRPAESPSPAAPAGKDQPAQPQPQHASGTAEAPSPAKKAVASGREPIPEVPQRLSVRRAVSSSLAHY